MWSFWTSLRWKVDLTVLSVCFPTSACREWASIQVRGNRGKAWHGLAQTLDVWIHSSCQSPKLSPKFSYLLPVLYVCFLWDVLALNGLSLTNIVLYLCIQEVSIIYLVYFHSQRAAWRRKILLFSYFAWQCSKACNCFTLFFKPQYKLCKYT